MRDNVCAEVSQLLVDELDDGWYVRVVVEREIIADRARE